MPRSFFTLQEESLPFLQNHFSRESHMHVPKKKKGTNIRSFDRARSTSHGDGQGERPSTKAPERPQQQKSVTAYKLRRKMIDSVRMMKVIAASCSTDTFLYGGGGGKVACLISFALKESDYAKTRTCYDKKKRSSLHSLSFTFTPSTLLNQIKLQNHRS